MSSDCDWSSRNIELSEERLCFDVLYGKKLFRRLRLRVHGNYNMRNALAATAILHHLEVPEDDIREGLESFSGVRRRLQLRADIGGIRVYEDFAHHPTAVRETLEAVRNTYKPSRIWAVYEPRSATSRRNVFQHEIAEALGRADCIALPALFKPEKVPEGERLNEDRLVEDLRRMGRAAWNLETVDGIIEKVSEEARLGDYIVIMSNGAFGGICEKLPRALKMKTERSAE